ncbi:MAG: carboxylesterase family protein [Candidatus Xenobia bacterium]
MGTLLFRSLPLPGRRARGAVYLPEGWSVRRKWPVILFLHGSGERGRDAVAPTRVGLGSHLAVMEAVLPAVVVFPQCWKGQYWTEDEMSNLALVALEQAEEEFHGDRKRIYLTGISMGGYGTVHLACEQPRRFAAAIPVCGGVCPPPGSHLPAGKWTYETVAQRLRSLPLWAFHGAKDDVIPVGESRRLVRALREVEAPVRYTECRECDHNSWDSTYSRRDLYRWLAAQSR